MIVTAEIRKLARCYLVKSEEEIRKLVRCYLVKSLPGAAFCPQAGDCRYRDQKISQMLPSEESARSCILLTS